MKKIIASVVLALALVIPISASSVWTVVADKFSPSVVFLEAVDGQGNPTGYCSGFIINVEKKYVLTAAHCDAEKILVNGTPTYRMFKDARKDLMVLRASAVDGTGPAIALAANNPKVGDEVAAIGFGFALEKVMVRISHISITNLDIEGLSGPFIMVDAGFMPGQSGGPVLDSEGKLVAIVQRGSDGLGIGVGAEVIKDRVGKYFESR